MFGLGIEAVWSRLPSDTPPRRAPAGIRTWFNARDPQDTVALYEVPADQYLGTPVVINYRPWRTALERWLLLEKRRLTAIWWQSGEGGAR